MKDATQEQIREQTGMCRYCEEPVEYFCPECWFGLCEQCLFEEDTDGECLGECYDKLPKMGDISIFPKEDAR